MNNIDNNNTRHMAHTHPKTECSRNTVAWHANITCKLITDNHNTDNKNNLTWQKVN